MRLAGVILILLLALLMVIGDCAYGQVYVTATAGGGGAGTAGDPYTMAEANAAASRETVYVASGTYGTGLSPQAPGVIYYAQTRYGPLIRDITTGISFSYDSCQAIGFRVQNVTSAAILDSVVYCHISYCRFDTVSNSTRGLYIDSSSYCTVKNSYMNMRRDSINYTIDGTIDGIELNVAAHHNVIEDDTLTQVPHVGVNATYGADYNTNWKRWNVIRGLVAYNVHTGIGVAFRNFHFLVEDCKVYHVSRIDTASWGHPMQMQGDSMLVRFNRFYEDTSVWANAIPGMMHKGSTQLYTSNESNDAQPMNDIHVAHNTMHVKLDNYNYAAGRYRRSFVVAWDVDTAECARNRIWNNVIVQSHPQGPAVYDQILGNTSYDGVKWAGNIVWNSAQGTTDTSVYLYRTTLDDEYTVAGAISALPSWWLATNLQVSPLFTDSTTEGAGRSFAWDSTTSPCYDGAVALTNANGDSTNATTCYVTDALWFYDGWGMGSLGEVGDSIKIGTAAAVGITAIDYATNKLTLSSARSWSSSADVYYWRNGQVVDDIGQYQYPEATGAASGKRYIRGFRR